MSISINGNGITSANIADGAITNADITDVAASKLTGALPAISGAALTGINAKVLNHIVSVAGITNTGNQSGGSWYTGQSVDYTPLSDNSTIYVMSNGVYQEYNNSDGAGNMSYNARMLVNNTTASVSFNSHTNFYSNTESHIVREHSISHSISNSSTSSINIKFQAYANGSARVEFRSVYGIYMQITEVAN